MARKALGKHKRSVGVTTVFTKLTTKQSEMEFNIKFSMKIKLILSKDGHLHFCEIPTLLEEREQAG